MYRGVLFAFIWNPEMKEQSVRTCKKHSAMQKRWVYQGHKRGSRRELQVCIKEQVLQRQQKAGLRGSASGF